MIMKITSKLTLSVALWGILIDLMCLPVLPKIHLPISAIVVICIFIFMQPQARLYLTYKSIALEVFLGCIIVSTALSLAFKPATAIINNGVVRSIVNTHFTDIKKAGYFLIAVLYFITAFFISKYMNKNTVMRICQTCITITFIFAILLFFVSNRNYLLYVQIRNVIFGTNVDLSDISAISYSGYLQRFLFVLLDPNNACYYIQMLATFQIGYVQARGFHKVIALLVFLAVPFATQSTGGMAGTIIIVLIYIFLQIKQLKTRPRIHAISIVVLFLIIILICIFTIIDGNQNMSLLSSLLQSQNGVINRWQTNSMDGRFERYLFVVKNFCPYLIGCGYTLVYKGLVFFPHSDHLRLIYAYGIIPYICLLKMISSNVKLQLEYIFLIPTVIAFTINSVIDEPRFLYTFSVFFAISVANLYKDELNSVQ